MAWTAKESGFDSQEDAEIFCFPQHPGLLQSTTGHLFNVYRELFL
jgi:hypothetical protein